jgi:predicted MFS family arabinose efflux permease
VIVALAGVTYAIIDAPRASWTSAQTLGLFALSLAALAALVPYELRRPDPLIEPRFFRSPPFSGATLIAICGFAGFAGFLLLNTLYLQDVRGYTPLQAGLCTLPMAVLAGAMAPLSGRIVGSRGARSGLIFGGACMLAAPLLLTGLSASTPLGLLLGAYALYGMGFGAINPPITYTAVSGMPDSQAGVAAAVASTSRQVGQTLGVALIGSIIGSATGVVAGAGLAQASHPAWWVISGCGAAVLALGIASTGAWAQRTARRAAAALASEEPSAPPLEPSLGGRAA